VIDASGDAVAATQVGATVVAPSGEGLQNATLIFRVSGAAPESLRGYGRLRIAALVDGVVGNGDLPPECDSVLVCPGEAYISLRGCLKIY